ncbi:Hypothetical predicted protein [Mytilus galloprovincialis]|uniref:ATP-dependent DNA helicase n=1 Tax=Mytilus galloprovincialis TaxID=29158 RepID=A0A8B6CSN6_MYTGA|nr:Hypothetical predicted protein [Mytilus galloprovincialis]
MSLVGMNIEFPLEYCPQSCMILSNLTTPSPLVIVCGDFKQLPPVPNHRPQDDGCYYLESDVFKNAFVHHINFTKVIRQNEADLIKAVLELCDGSPSVETVVLLQSLDRPLPDIIKITSLYGTNFDVNFINHEKLEELAGEEFVFKAKDEGQMGVAVGRVETKAGLRVRNFNRSAATLKHPSCVYDFYNFINMKEPLGDLSCCKKNTTRKQSSIVLPSTSDLIDNIPEDPDNENDAEIDLDLPTLQNPYEIQDFLLDIIKTVLSCQLFLLIFIPLLHFYHM